MAQPAVADTIPVVNGDSSSHPGSPQSLNSATKRKRDVSDDVSSPDLNSGDQGKPMLKGGAIARDDKTLIRNYFEVLKSYDISPSILKRQLSESVPDDEPQTKRQKSEDGHAAPTITEKIMADGYDLLEDVVLDITHAVRAQISEMQAAETEETAQANEEAIAKVTRFKDKALELFRREMSYPRGIAPQLSQLSKLDSKDAPPASTGGSQILTVWGMGIKAMPLFSSLPNPRSSPAGSGDVPKPVNEASLPNGVALTRIVPTPLGAEKPGRPLTLGELFPSPRNLPPLQPPKAAKTTTKSNILSFYHPELAEKSKYRVNTYFSQTISAGHYLDYSNATPSSQIKTKQRERAQSLAGHKPSSMELEMSEMEALFRGAFSSFAPCKDDSAAMVSSGQVGRMWWQRVGRRNFDRMVEAEISEDELEAGKATAPSSDMEVDEALVQDAVNSWDDSAIDPSLDEVMGKRPVDENDVDELLQVVSDGIETLASFQRNRNLALPTSQDRHSMDPINGDMLRNGSSAHQPSEEETLTYKAIRTQLCLLIQGLPPYMVARLNSDKLAELNISTKIEVRMDEYKGVAEEDEAARVRSQQQAAMQAAANTVPRPAHRNPSVSSVPYANQYGGHYATAANRPPMPSPQPYPQTPVRPPPPSIYQQRSASAVPIPQPPPQSQHRPPPTNPPYRPPTNGYGGYAPQLAKAQTPYGHTNLPQYAGAPNQPRIAQHPGYTSLGQANSPNHRYSPAYPPGYSPAQQMHPQQHAQHQGYSPYTNGTPAMPPRTISPQVAGQPHPYGHSPAPQQQMNRPPYGPPQPGMPPSPAQRYYSPGTPGMAASGGQARGLTGYATVMEEGQERRVVEQAKALAFARDASQRFGDKISQGGVSGLAGIGLGGNVDMAKLAAARANRAAMSESPKPQVGSPLANSPGPGQPVNGMQAAAGSIPAPASSVSPASTTGGFQAPPPS